MSKVEVDQRLLSLETGVPLQSIRRAKHLPWQQLNDGFSRLANMPLYLDDSGALRLTEIRTRARRMKARHPDLALVVVDYLQLMTGPGDNRVQEVSAISRGLKSLARDLDTPVLALSQLSRNLEYRTDKRPILSDLRDSGSIEQDSDLVIFIYRESVYLEADETESELIVAKHRNGPIDTVKPAWDKYHARFNDA
jgi:replicative DNA helicase